MTDRNITRRSVVKAGAWSVPVIALATAIPQAAASTTGDWTLIQLDTVVVEASRNLGVVLRLDGASESDLAATTWDVTLNGSLWVPELTRNIYQGNDIWLVPFSGPWPLEPADPVAGFQIIVDIVAHTPQGDRVISQVTALQLV